LWTIKNGQTPPLVVGNGGAILFGGALDYEGLSGARFSAGYWFDPCQCWGVDGSIFFLGERSIHFSDFATATGTALVGRPIVDQNGNIVVQLAGGNIPPQAANGGVAISSKTELWGADVDGVANLCRWCCGRLDAVGGFRYLHLREDVNITENPMFTAGPNANASFVLNDRFAARNDFYGGQLGLKTEWSWGRWRLDATGKVALGSSHEVVDINGNTLITPPTGAPASFVGGLLAQPTNIGHFSTSRFAVVPEVGVNVGYQLTDHLRAYVGYNFLYWSRVARPGDQIDNRVNTTQLPHLINGVPTPGMLVGPALPAFTFRETDFWAQGVNFGLEFRF
jgi:hypothetical protein